SPGRVFDAGQRVRGTLRPGSKRAHRRPRRCQSKTRERTAPMRAINPARILIVAHRTADSRDLIDVVARRAAEGSCSFTLLVPTRPRGLHRVVDPEDHGVVEAEARLAEALPALSRA